MGCVAVFGGSRPGHRRREAGRHGRDPGETRRPAAGSCGGGWKRRRSTPSARRPTTWRWFRRGRSSRPRAARSGGRPAEWPTSREGSATTRRAVPVAARAPGGGERRARMPARRAPRGGGGLRGVGGGRRWGLAAGLVWLPATLVPRRPVLPGARPLRASGCFPGAGGHPDADGGPGEPARRSEGAGGETTPATWTGWCSWRRFPATTPSSPRRSSKARSARARFSRIWEPNSSNASTPCKGVGAVAELNDALAAGETLLFFPEGTFPPDAGAAAVPHRRVRLRGPGRRPRRSRGPDRHAIYPEVRVLVPEIRPRADRGRPARSLRPAPTGQRCWRLRDRVRERLLELSGEPDLAHETGVISALRDKAEA